MALASPTGAMVAPAGASVTVPFGNGVSLAARKSGPIGSPAGPVAGLVAEETAKLKVAAASSTMLPPPNVTAPVTVIFAPANGMPANPAVDANAAPSKGAAIQSVPLPSVMLAALGTGAPKGVIT